MNLPRIGLVGIGGYGRVHLQHLREFHRRGELEFVAAVAFPAAADREAAEALRAEGCVVVESFDELLRAQASLRLGLVVVSTPIHLHARMTIALLRAGIDVLVEKPLAATIEDAEAIIARRDETGRSVAVGFQYLHAPEVWELKRRLIAGAIGPLRRLTVHAAWPRSHAYYQRNAWAGQLRLNGDWVLDSPLSNAMSHFMMVMLFLGGQELATFAEPAIVSAELYRAQAITSFDTAAVRLQTPAGLRLDFYGTHSSQNVGRPSLHIQGASGEAEWVQDRHARITAPGQLWQQQAAPEADTRERMLRNLLAHRRGHSGPIVTPEMAAIHVRCIAELHRSATIESIAPQHRAEHGINGEVFTYVPGLDEVLVRAAQDGVSLAEVDAPWAQVRS